MPVEANRSAHTRIRANTRAQSSSATPSTGNPRQHIRAELAPASATVKRPSPLAREVVVEEQFNDSDEDSEGVLPDERFNSQTDVEEESWNESGSLEYDVAFSHLDLQAGESFMSPSRSPSPPAHCPAPTDTVNYYLNLDRPFITVIIMDNAEALGMYHACMREGRKARLEFVLGSKTVVIYAPKSSTYQEVASYIRIRVLSIGERLISKATASVRRASRVTVRRASSASRATANQVSKVSRSCANYFRGAQFWATLFTATLMSSCVIIVSMCLAFDSCLDVVASPEKVARLIGNILLLILGCLIYGTKLFVGLIVSMANRMVNYLVSSTTLLNKQAHDGAQSLIRTAIAFLEAFLSIEDLDL